MFAMKSKPGEGTLAERDSTKKSRQIELPDLKVKVIKLDY